MPITTTDASPDQVLDIASRTFTPRTATQFQRPYHVTVEAVGRSVIEALEALASRHAWGKVEKIEFQKEIDAPCEWYVRFLAEDGTSMKAWGEYVTGGVLVLGWK